MAGFLANKSIAQADVQTTLTCHLSHSFDLFLSGRIPSVVGGRVNFLFDLSQKIIIIHQQPKKMTLSTISILVQPVQ